MRSPGSNILALSLAVILSGGTLMPAYERPAAPIPPPIRREVQT